jgi:acyl carrier protein
MADNDAQRQKLVACFTQVFEGLSPAEAPAASVENRADWDSMKTLILVSEIEQNLGVSLDYSTFLELTSFRAFCDRLDIV